MSSDSNVFNKDNLNQYLNELSKAYKKLGGKNMPAEIILIGGAAIIENYGFRDMTTDIDAVIHAASVMDDAIRQVGNKFHLPIGWLNSDFTKTESYSRKIEGHSVFYKLSPMTALIKLLLICMAHGTVFLPTLSHLSKARWLTEIIKEFMNRLERTSKTRASFCWIFKKNIPPC